jgi:hypothetical protein
VCALQISWNTQATIVFIGVVSVLTLLIDESHVGALVVAVLRSLWP